MQILGIDIGGTGVKGAPVDVERGELAAPRCRMLTPQPATPAAVAARVGEVIAHFGYAGPVGIGFPGAVQHGVVRFAPHMDASWIGQDAQGEFGKVLRVPVAVLNETDAAGLAEMRFGAGRDVRGVVAMITLGTGIGTALFVDGVLVPNTEFGHIEIRGKDAELRASELARQRKHMSWKKWARRVDEYLAHLERLVWPDLIIVGGGGSRHHEKFISRLTLRTRVVPAQLLNDAGIVGAALAVSG
jgi:polyphosphate glucokinase